MYTRHVTLTATVVATVEMDAPYETTEIVNRDGTAEVYFTRDGSTPTVGGDNTEVLPAAICGIVLPYDSDEADVVKMISAGTPKVSVIGR